MRLLFSKFTSPAKVLLQLTVARIVLKAYYKLRQARQLVLFMGYSDCVYTAPVTGARSVYLCTVTYIRAATRE